MKSLKSWKMNFKRRSPFEGGKWGVNMRQFPCVVILCIGMLFIVYRSLKFQHHETERDARIFEKMYPFDSSTEGGHPNLKLRNLPRGIVQAASDLEMRPLWSHGSQKSKVEPYDAKLDSPTYHYLLAMAVGIKQKRNVDLIVQKFLPVNFTVILFHYDGELNQWDDLEWSSQALHIIAQKQTKWWFAKRFLYPNIVSLYDYVFLWDEDLGVEHFHPGRYLKIVKSVGLEISQPALDPNSTEVHHRITIRSRTKKFHRRVWDVRGSVKCTNTSWGPPCTGICSFIQNDLVHGWGMDIKLGYCAQGDRTKKVGVVDSEFIFHHGIQSLGGGGHPGKKAWHYEQQSKRRTPPAIDVRAEIRRQSTRELETFKKRWNEGVKEDEDWSDPFTKDSIIAGDEYDGQR